ncbi:MAG: EAL domain-containing protein, partial [Pseudomonadota bacterium]
LVYWVAFQRNITALKQREKQAEAALEERLDLERNLAEALQTAEHAESRLWNILNTLSDGFVLYDPDDRIVIANEAFRNFHSPIRDDIGAGVSFEEILRRGIEKDIWNFEGADPEDWIQGQLERRKGVTEASTLVRLKDGRWMQRKERRLPNGEMAGLRVDVTDFKLQERRLEETARLLEITKAEIQRQAVTDSLTGIANRLGLEDHLRHLAKSATEDDHITLLHIDLDRFKQINDTMGHSAGDFILRAAVTLIRPLMSETDFIARIGGDEFVLARCVHEDDSSLEGLARQIIHKLSRPIPYQGRPCRFSACIGIAQGPMALADPSQLMIDADVALRHAKDAGRGRVETFSSKLESAVVTKKQVADEILAGLEKTEFFPYFQPQFDTASLHLVGVEALARWQHPERGVLAPVAFLDVAEDLNVVAEIDRMILEQSVRRVRELEAEGITVPKVSVNVSLKRLLDPDLMRGLDEIDTSTIDLSFELLETIFLDDQDDRVDWCIDQLQERGIEIEIDDFGSGRASIVGLTRVRPKRMKIDRQLVAPITNNLGRERLLSAIVEIGKSLGISVTAEGAETMKHVDLLREMGCDTVQGFALAKPMPFDQLRTLLKAGQQLTA